MLELNSSNFSTHLKHSDQLPTYCIVKCSPQWYPGLPEGRGQCWTQSWWIWPREGSQGQHSLLHIPGLDHSRHIQSGIPRCSRHSRSSQRCQCSALHSDQTEVNCENLNYLLFSSLLPGLGIFGQILRENQAIGTIAAKKNVI